MKVLLSKWAAEGRVGVEVQLADVWYNNCSVGIVEFVKGATYLH